MNNYPITTAALTYVCGVMLLVPGYVSELHAKRYAIESSVSSGIAYNDNVFLTTDDVTSASDFSVSPKVKISMEEANWAVSMGLMIRSSKHTDTDSDLDSNEQRYNASVSYQDEKSQSVINAGYNVTSSLNSESSDFGLVRTQVDRNTFTLSPRYSINLTGRMSLSLSYGFTDVEYDDTINSGFVPYVTRAPSAAFNYNLSERSQISLLSALTSYESDDGLSEYDMRVVQLNYNYNFSEIVSGRVLYGRSNRDVTTQTTTAPTPFFLGTQIAQIYDVETESNGAVYNAELTQNIHNGVIKYKVSQDNKASSFGSLDEVRTVSVSANQKTSDLWAYGLSSIYSDTTNIGSGTVASGRTVLNVRGHLRYSIRRNLQITGSYVYSIREFDSQVSNTRPDSNKIYIGLTYLLPEYASY